MRILHDPFGRTFSYLRLSVTDACNFRCRYCLPQGYQAKASCGDPAEDTFLSLHEIRNLVQGFSALGFSKVRLTGGEPTLRRDIVDIVACIARIPEIHTIALTTNGYRLATLAPSLRQAGLSAVNVSIDSLDSERFAQITGTTCRIGTRVLEGVHAALRAGIPQVKINVVALRSFFERDKGDFLRFVHETPVTVRFIELMETGDSRDFFRREHVSGDEIKAYLISEGWQTIERKREGGPAIEYGKAGARGKLGVIAAYSPQFCEGCNRLRVSARGKLRLCLFGKGEHALRSLLQTAEQRPLLIREIENTIFAKKAAHQLHQGDWGDTTHLAAIGG